jgi:hypothetical protein
MTEQDRIIQALQAERAQLVEALAHKEAGRQAALRLADDLKAALEEARGGRDEAMALLQDILASESICNCGPYFREGEALKERVRAFLGAALARAGGVV